MHILLLGLAATVPWFGLMVWANLRAHGRIDAPAVQDAPPWAIALVWLAGAAVVFLVWATVMELGHLPLEGFAFDVSMCMLFGTAFMAPLAAYHLWITRHLWRHGGVARLARRRARAPR